MLRAGKIAASHPAWDDAKTWRAHILSCQDYRLLGPLNGGIGLEYLCALERRIPTCDICGKKNRWEEEAAVAILVRSVAHHRHVTMHVIEA